MNLVPGIRLALRSLYRRPAAVLPYYLAAAGVAVVGQTVTLAGGIAAYLLLADAGRLIEFADAVAGLDFAGLDPADPDPAAAEALLDALGLLVTPGTVAVGALAVLGALVLALVAGAVAAAAQIHAVRAVLVDEAALPAGVTGVGRDGWRFVRLALLRLVLYAVPLGLVALAVAAASAVSVALGFLVGLAAVLVLIPVGLAVYVALLFVPQAVVIDDVGVLGAVRHNLRFVRANAWTAAGYVAVQLGLSFAVGSAGGALVVFSMPQVVPLLSLVVVAPFVGLLGTALYLDPEPAPAEWGTADDAPPPDAGAPLPDAGTRARAAGRRGLRELGRFTRGNLGLVAVALVVFAVGTAAGWRATSALPLLAQAAPLPGEAFGLVPVDDFVNIAANNWRVAVAQAFGGAALGVPAAANLLFNGIVVGAIAGAGFDPVVFAAFVVPHGLVEVPALAVAGALGLSLGRDVWRYWRGRTDADDLAASVERAFWALVGLVPVFVLAAFVEAFLTPWIGTLVAGGV